MEVWEKPSGDGPDQASRDPWNLDRRSGSGRGEHRAGSSSVWTRPHAQPRGASRELPAWCSVDPLGADARTHESRRSCDSSSYDLRLCPTVPCAVGPRASGDGLTDRGPPVHGRARSRHRRPRLSADVVARAPPRSRCGSSGHARCAGHPGGARGHLVLPMSSAHDKKDAPAAVLIHPCFYRGPDQLDVSTRRGVVPRLVRRRTTPRCWVSADLADLQA